MIVNRDDRGYQQAAITRKYKLGSFKFGAAKANNASTKSPMDESGLDPTTYVPLGEGSGRYLYVGPGSSQGRDTSIAARSGKSSKRWPMKPSALSAESKKESPPKKSARSRSRSRSLSRSRSKSRSRKTSDRTSSSPLKRADDATVHCLRGNLSQPENKVKCSRDISPFLRKNASPSRSRTTLLSQRSNSRDKSSRRKSITPNREISSCRQVSTSFSYRTSPRRSRSPRKSVTPQRRRTTTPERHRAVSPRRNRPISPQNQREQPLQTKREVLFPSVFKAKTQDEKSAPLTTDPLQEHKSTEQRSTTTQNRRFQGKSMSIKRGISVGLASMRSGDEDRRKLGSPSTVEPTKKFWQKRKIGLESVRKDEKMGTRNSIEYNGTKCSSSCAGGKRAKNDDRNLAQHSAEEGFEVIAIRTAHGNLKTGVLTPRTKNVPSHQTFGDSADHDNPTDASIQTADLPFFNGAQDCLVQNLVGRSSANFPVNDVFDACNAVKQIVQVAVYGNSDSSGCDRSLQPEAVAGAPSPIVPAKILKISKIRENLDLHGKNAVPSNVHPLATRPWPDIRTLNKLRTGQHFDDYSRCGNSLLATDSVSMSTLSANVPSFACLQLCRGHEWKDNISKASSETVCIKEPSKVEAAKPPTKQEKPVIKREDTVAVDPSDWKEIVEATGTLDQKFIDLVGEGGGLYFSRKTVQEINRALATIRRHANRLHVDEKELIAAVRDDHEAIASLASPDSSTRHRGGGATKWLGMFQFHFGRKAHRKTKKPPPPETIEEEGSESMLAESRDDV